MVGKELPLCHTKNRTKDTRLENVLDEGYTDKHECK